MIARLRQGVIEAVTGRHCMSDFVIEVDTDDARSRCYLIAVNNAAAPVSSATAVYEVSLAVASSDRSDDDGQPAQRRSFRGSGAASPHVQRPPAGSMGSGPTGSDNGRRRTGVCPGSDLLLTHQAFCSKGALGTEPGWKAAHPRRRPAGGTAYDERVG